MILLKMHGLCVKFFYFKWSAEIATEIIMQYSVEAVKNLSMFTEYVLYIPYL